MPKISELDLASVLNVSNNDLLVLVDSETSSTKKIKVIDFAMVIANILNIPAQKDAGADLLGSYPSPVDRQLGVPVASLDMETNKLLDNYDVDSNQSTYLFQYNTYILPNRFIVVGESLSFLNSKQVVSHTILYDTSSEVTANTSVSICKPFGITKIKIYISSVSQSSFTYTLSNTNTDCAIQITPIPATPTPTETPIVTPTPTETSRTAGWVEATPTVTPTISVTPSVTPTLTPTNSPTASVTPSVTPTYTPSQNP